MYKPTFTHSFKKEFDRLPKDIRQRISEAYLVRAEKVLKSAKLLEEIGESEDTDYTIVTSFLAKP